MFHGIFCRIGAVCLFQDTCKPSIGNNIFVNILSTKNIIAMFNLRMHNKTICFLKTKIQGAFLLEMQYVAKLRMAP